MAQAYDIVTGSRRFSRAEAARGRGFSLWLVTVVMGGRISGDVVFELKPMVAPVNDGGIVAIKEVYL